jgi:hypothetical protein
VVALIGDSMIRDETSTTTIFMFNELSNLHPSQEHAGRFPLCHHNAAAALSEIYVSSLKDIKGGVRLMTRLSYQKHSISMTSSHC